MSTAADVSPPESLEPVLPIPPRPYRSRARRLVAPLVLLAVVAVLCVVWFGVYRHLMGMAAISLRGGQVNWDLAEGKWKRGGESALSYGPRPWHVGDDAFTPVADLNHVVSLDLSNVDQISPANYALLKKLPDLRYLYLSHSDETIAPGVNFLHDPVLPNISGHHDLLELYLDGQPITDRGLATLADLPKLEVIDLSRTAVTDAGLLHLLAFPNLKTVHVDGAKITDEGIGALVSRRPEIEVIRADPKGRANPPGY